MQLAGAPILPNSIGQARCSKLSPIACVGLHHLRRKERRRAVAAVQVLVPCGEDLCNIADTQIFFEIAGMSKLFFQKVSQG